MSARNFPAASSNFLRGGQPAVTGQPLTLAAWGRPADLTVAYRIYAGLFNSSASTDYIAGMVTAGGSAQMIVSDSSGTNNCTASTTLTIGAWHHFCLRHSNLASFEMIVNAAFGSKGSTGSNTKAPTGINRVSMGRHDQSTGNPWNGDLGPMAVWNVALTDDEITALAIGMPPLLVRPASLVHYWPAIGGGSPIPDIVGGIGFSINGTTVADEAPPAQPMPATRRASASATIFSLSATAVAAGAPVAGTPAIGQKHVLSTAAHATGAPALTAPILVDTGAPPSTKRRAVVLIGA